jgi:hypothetical protein
MGTLNDILHFLQSLIKNNGGGSTLTLPENFSLKKKTRVILQLGDLKL